MTSYALASRASAWPVPHRSCTRAGTTVCPLPQPGSAPGSMAGATHTDRPRPSYPLVRTGGYAVQAHGLVERPSQDFAKRPETAAEELRGRKTAPRTGRAPLPRSQARAPRRHAQVTWRRSRRASRRRSAGALGVRLQQGVGKRVGEQPLADLPPVGGIAADSNARDRVQAGLVAGRAGQCRQLVRRRQGQGQVKPGEEVLQRLPLLAHVRVVREPYPEHLRGHVQHGPRSARSAFGAVRAGGGRPLPRLGSATGSPCGRGRHRADRAERPSLGPGRCRSCGARRVRGPGVLVRAVRERVSPVLRCPGGPRRCR